MTYKLVFETKAHQMSILCISLMGEFLCSGSTNKSVGMWNRERETYGKLYKVRGYKWS